MKDWSLILYTLILQAAAGIFVFSRLRMLASQERAVRLRCLPLVGVLGVIGVLVSFLHLGSPMQAYLTMNNVGTSWLSREILFTVIFGACWAVGMALEYWQSGGLAMRNSWHGVSVLAALGLIYSMSMLYRSTVVPSWMHVSTTISFFATAGLIGAGAVLVRELLAGEKAGGWITPLAVTVLVLMGVQTITVATHLVYLGGAGPQAQATAALLMGPWLPWLWLRLGLTVFGAAVLMAWAWQRWATVQAVKAVLPLAGAAVAVITLGEVLGRVLFFTTRVQIGL